MGEKRDQKRLESYCKQFTLKERKLVKCVAMDIYGPYIAATKAYIPEAKKKIAFDRYHVMRLVVDAMDKVRKQEHRFLAEQGNEIVKRTKYLWLWNIENIPEYRKAEFDSLRSPDLKVCRARAIKDNLRQLWDYRKQSWMRKYYTRRYFLATHSRLKPMINAAKSLKSHLDNIVTYGRHRITNTLGERINSKIEKVKRPTCGYRNRDQYKLRSTFIAVASISIPEEKMSLFTS